VQSISVPILIAAMGGYHFIRDDEIIFEKAASQDKDYIVIEGAVHGFGPCTACETAPGCRYRHAFRQACISCLIPMMALPLETWVRFFVWLLIGFAIYFPFGRKRSALAGGNGDNLVETLISSRSELRLYTQTDEQPIDTQETARAPASLPA
jgi:C-terminus of AA_permease